MKAEAHLVMKPGVASCAMDRVPNLVTCKIGLPGKPVDDNEPAVEALSKAGACLLHAACVFRILLMWMDVL